MLLKCINNSPGIRYRELLLVTGFPNGVMAYHLRILEKFKELVENTEKLQDIIL